MRGIADSRCAARTHASREGPLAGPAAIGSVLVAVDKAGHESGPGSAQLIRTMVIPVAAGTVADWPPTLRTVTTSAALRLRISEKLTSSAGKMIVPLMVS